ncbi:flavoprotein [Spiractinospora alimapuensis]|uniref:flavoprotein n=1 Tax=Spiractinospora alimapuensis TaxID=2820884 RepID=UPI001F3DC53F|nr:flavoprotein [Spiractinospora alimapuensis]QVQ51071.1 flavoprotein [Spiractinospora alimapuensis]
MGVRTLYLVVSGAPAPEGLVSLVRAVQAEGYRVGVVSTPNGTRFHDMDALEEITGQAVRVDYRMPGTGSSLPPADAVVACPLTFNSTNKFAQGIADCFAIGLLCELVGYDVPTIVVPHCKPQLASHPAFQNSLNTLRAIPSVTLIHDPTAPYHRRIPPWETLINTLRTTAT